MREAFAIGYAAYLQEHAERHLTELQDFLRIPSISALSAHRGDIEAAARWLVARLRQSGLTEAEVMETDGLPVVYGSWQGAPGAPTVLVYGHYDVQPVDPLALWQTPPFAPRVQDGRIYARGACDDKGQVFMHLAAIEALLQTTGRLPVNLKVLIEGEEEVGSPNLAPFLAAHPERFAADVVLISDTGMWQPGVPALCIGVRGLTGLELDLRGAATDMHSGVYGGAVHNPLHALARLLASLHDDQGRVAVAGFYGGVRELSAAERAEMAALGFDAAALQQEVGAPALYGEAGFSVLERIWARPTLEVNGAWGGFQGEGSKTVIPAVAHAKITCRLVPDQDPGQVLDAVHRHLERHCPPGVTLTVRRGVGARPWLAPTEHPALSAAAAALTETFGQRTVFVRMGGSIPVVEVFAARMGVPIVLMGFGLTGDNVHAPNESFRLDHFYTGMRAICTYLQRLPGVL